MSELLDSEKKACIKKGIANDLDSLLGRDCSAFLSVMICRYPGGMTRILSSVAGEVPAEDILNYGANGIAALLAQATAGPYQASAATSGKAVPAAPFSPESR